MLRIKIHFKVFSDFPSVSAKINSFLKGKGNVFARLISSEKSEVFRTILMFFIFL